LRARRHAEGSLELRPQPRAVFEDERVVDIQQVQNRRQLVEELMIATNEHAARF
jgi:exoribonuclease R